MEVPGLSVIPDFVSQHQHDWLVGKIDSLPWDNRLKRRTQHYGWNYRYDRSLLQRDSSRAAAFSRSRLHWRVTGMAQKALNAP